jgi:hypothetical protein
MAKLKLSLFQFSSSLKTTDWRKAQQRERDLQDEAKAGKVAADSKRKSLSRLSFKDAAERFIADRAPSWAPLTVRTERERSASRQSCSRIADRFIPHARRCS